MSLLFLYTPFTFASPIFLLFLPLLALFAVYRWRQNRTYAPDFRLSSTESLTTTTNPSPKITLRTWLWVLPIVALGLLSVAMARPQTLFDDKKVYGEGIDIIIALDISGSMKARDFEPDRLGAAKQLAEQFIDQRNYDKIGLVVFSGESFTQCPLTTDHNILKSLMQQVEEGMVDDGTAIGMGLATAVTRLKESKAKSKVVILLTDGVNNSGFVDPLTATETAQQFGVKVYTIGVGTQGEAPYPVQDFFGRQMYQQVPVEIDEKLLQQIASLTNGKYYRATDNNSLAQVYNEINQLEKTKVEVTTIQRRTEHFYIFALIGALLLLIEWTLRHTFLKGIAG